MSRMIGLALALAFFVPACGGGGGGSGEAQLVLNLVDSPVDGADNVFVTVERVDLIRLVDGVEEFITVVDTPQEYDLLLLQNDVKAVLGQGTFPPGQYAGMRLIVASGKPGGGPLAGNNPNRIVIDGESHPLDVPSGMQTGIKLNDPFWLSPDVINELTIDINVRHSVVKLGSKDNFHFKPRLHLIEEIFSGTVAGTVTSTDVDTPLPTATVSAQQGGEEILSARITENGTYKLAPLLAGTYTLVVTAPGFATQVQDNVVVVAAVDLTGQDFMLDPTDTGAISGTVGTPDETMVLHLMQDGHFISLAGPDLTTGAFVFEGVPVGTYDVVLLSDGGGTARADGVVVTVDATADAGTLGN